MAISKEVLDERERIKAVIQRKIEGIEIICLKKKTKRGQKTISKRTAIQFLKNILFWIDNPDYVRVKDRVKEE